jgi:hypothetical protein
MNRTRWRSWDVQRNTDSPRSGMRGAAGLLAATLLLAACGGGGDDKASPAPDQGGDQRALTSTTVASGASTPAQPDGQVAAAVEAAYRDATAAELAFDSEVGQFDPVAFRDRVGRYITGSQYDFSFKVSQERRLRGEVFSPPGLQPGEIAPVVTLVGQGRATVRDCAADHPTIKASTGERADEPIDGREVVLSEMVLIEGQWKIARTTVPGERCTV